MNDAFRLRGHAVRTRSKLVLQQTPIENRQRTFFYIEAIRASLKMDRSMTDFRTARNFARLSRDVPLFSSLEELHEKLTELLGNFSMHCVTLDSKNR